MSTRVRFRWNDVTVQAAGVLTGDELRIAARRAPASGERIAVRTARGEGWSAPIEATVLHAEGGSFTCALDAAPGVDHPEAPAEDRRAAARTAVHFKVRFASARAFVEQHATNLSSGGIFVATARQLPIGTPVRIEMGLPDGGPPIGVDAEVMRAVLPGNPSGRKPGLGLRFVGANEEMNRRVEAFMRSLAGA